MARTVAAPELLRYEEARGRVLAAVAPGAEERVPLERARGRAARSRLIASFDLPPFPNASMDGAAVHSAALAGAGAVRRVELPVAATHPAGSAPAPLPEGACVWIMTGAPLPEGADAVVPVEDVVVLEGAQPDRPGGRLGFEAPAPPGLNVRAAGADLRAGELAWEAGRELSAHDLAVLAALGEAEVTVGARPRVGIISTGDELLAPGAPRGAGTIYDGNRPMLQALVEEVRRLRAVLEAH